MSDTESQVGGMEGEMERKTNEKSEGQEERKQGIDKNVEMESKDRER